MATITASPPTMSPPLNANNNNPPSLPPLITSPPQPRRTSSQRPVSYAERRMSSYSTHSKASFQPQSRPVSHVFPAFHSSLPYTLVRDFAYPVSHPLHYGPPPIPSGMSTPASEARRLSDPPPSTWEDGRGQWSATPPWVADTAQGVSNHRLPAMAFKEGEGPPYHEDDDIHSPIVTTNRHKKHKSNDRGRSPGPAGPNRSVYVQSHGQDGMDGPGEAVENVDTLRFPAQPQHRDSNFAKPLQRNRSPYATVEEPASEDDFSEADEDDDDDDDAARYSKDYSFTIASPDEEMHGKAVALFDFESEHENELPLTEGQIILVSYRHGQGWLVAEDPRTGESGLVPEEFVRLARDIEGGIQGLIDGEETVTSPVSTDLETPIATTHPHNLDEPPHQSRPSNGERHLPVQSKFSTSSRDFSPRPKTTDESNTPTNATAAPAVQTTQDGAS